MKETQKSLGGVVVKRVNEFLLGFLVWKSESISAGPTQKFDDESRQKDENLLLHNKREGICLPVVFSLEFF